MAWIVMDLDQTLISDGADPTGGAGLMPVDGAVEACMQLSNEGHRLTVFTSRFAPMPDSERQRLKEQIEEELISYGFPPMEVWTGTTKPDADIFIGHNHITYDGDWGLVLAQANMMMSEMGLAPAMPTEQPMEGQPEEVDASGVDESNGNVEQ